MIHTYMYPSNSWLFWSSVNEQTLLFSTPRSVHAPFVGLGDGGTEGVVDGTDDGDSDGFEEATTDGLEETLSIELKVQLVDGDCDGLPEGCADRGCAG